MIQSMLDNDLYKFTMQQAVLGLYPDARAQYQFTNRGKTPFPENFAAMVQKEVEALTDLCLKKSQRKWLEQACPYFFPEYLDFLSDYRFDPGQIRLEQKGGSIELRIEGPWVSTILWEVPLMAIISELYFKLTDQKVLSRDQISLRNRSKAERLAEQGVRFADFGTRRRFSAQNHDQLIRDLLSVEGHTFAGTSNVHLAKKYSLPPIGTMAHEWIMFHSALGKYSDANSLAMDAWKKVYPDVLGIALTDTYTTDLFLRDFGSARAGQFDGVRQDSGDPLGFAEKLISHYRKIGIDPKEKTIVFSDGLDTQKAIEIHKTCRGKIKDAYGIGTHLTNDVGPKPLNMVIKLSGCSVNEKDGLKKTVKLSDDRGKHTGDKEALSQCLDELKPV